MSVREEQHEQRRRQILNIALSLFVTKGFYGTTTREISKQTGISSGLMFHYFDSKEALYEELVRIGCKQMELDYEQAQANPLMFLRDETEKIFTMIKQSSFFAKMFVFMNNAQNNKEVSQTVDELLARHNVIGQSAPLISKGQQLGQFRDGEPYALAMAFWCAIQGVSQNVVLAPDKELPQVDWLLDILRSKAGTNDPPQT
jgi:TetR/AcrR family transcriptional regulator